MQLVEWQSAFQHIVLTGHSGNADKKMGIYIDAYALRLIEALRTNYPAVHQLLGDDDFDVMARRYRVMHPPVHASIRWFGEHLASFLQAQQPYATLAVLAELAEFEWALRHTIDAADVKVLSLDTLQSINADQWGELIFSLHPSVSLLQLQWNTPPIWQALTQQTQTPEPASHLCAWLVYRQPDLASGWRSVSVIEVVALQGVQAGLCFAEICAALAQAVDDIDTVPSMAAGFLRVWVEQGLLSLRLK